MSLDVFSPRLFDLAGDMRLLSEPRLQFELVDWVVPFYFFFAVPLAVVVGQSFLAV